MRGIGRRALARGLAGNRAGPHEQHDERKREQQPEAAVSHAHESSGPRLLPKWHNFITPLSVVCSDNDATLTSRTMSQLSSHRNRLHRHTGVRTYVLLQRLGVPYEVERTVCSECRRVLDERRVKRAAA
jgi:hypothetical protein